MNDGFYLYTKGVSGIRNVMSREEIVNPRNIANDSYSSLFRFDISIKNYIESNGNVGGYNGPTYGDYFVLDFDAAPLENNKHLSILARAMLPLLNDLQSYEHYLFYSGYKGWHLYIPKYIVKYDPGYENNWKEISRKFANYIMAKYPGLKIAGGVNDDGTKKPALDTSIYDRVRIFRYPYSRHMKTRNEKIPRRYIGYHENLNDCFAKEDMTREEMLKIIFDNRDMPEPGDVEPIFDITGDVEEAVTTVNNSTTSGYTGDDYMHFGYMKKHCIVKMHNLKDNEGRRALILLRLIAHWYEEGLDTGSVMSIIRQWNSTLKKPLADKKIERAFQSYRQAGYKFGHKDKIKMQFCSKTCPYYNNKNDEEEYVFDSKSLTHKLVKHQTDTHQVVMDLSEHFKGVDVQLVPDYGHICLVAGGSSSGKTTLVCNLLYKYEYPTWFVSLDDSAVTVGQKLYKIAQLDPLKLDDRKKFDELMGHITINDNGSMYMEDLSNQYDVACSQAGTHIPIVVIDYAQMFLSKETSQEYARLGKLCSILKQFAKRKKCVVFLLSQIPKDTAGNGDKPFDLNAAKGSGELTNSADVQINVWREKILKEDNVMNLFFAKHKHGKAKFMKDLKFDGNTFSVVCDDKDIYQMKVGGNSNTGINKEALQLLANLFGGMISEQIIGELRN